MSIGAIIAGYALIGFFTEVFAEYCAVGTACELKLDCMTAALITALWPIWWLVMLAAITGSFIRAAALFIAHRITGRK